MPLFSPGAARDSIYEKIRDCGSADFCERIESMWVIYQQHADPDFLEKAKEDFGARLWEMHLGCSLLERGYRLAPKKHSKGPDICILTSDGKIWIEATVPGPGTTADKVTENASGEIREVPTDKIILRLRGAIEAKHAKYKEYLRDGIVAKREPFVIAICGVKIPSAHCEDEPPLIVKAVFPYGPSAMRYEIDPKQGIRPVEKFLTYQPEVVNHNQAPVSKDIFLDCTYESISGVLYSLQGIHSYCDDFVFVHNPLATAPLPLGFIRSSTEYWVEYELKKSVAS
ncbi:MAG: hypothetical protein EXS18_06275 [Verrucomicrobiae bacterium]|nr:hypothetical protein [Verrucomicrobiae bacterium]